MSPANDRELVVTRIIDAPRERVYRAWTDPKLLVQWFAPRPWTTSSCEIDLRPGGVCNTVMRDPDGKAYPNTGVYLEVVKNEKIVFTDAYEAGWRPSGKPFMTVFVTLEDLGGKTRYTARVLHWTAADREAHEQMGFHEGWGQCTDQLAEIVAKL